MFVEAFHRVLKYVYLKGTVNKRIDACISMLLRFARDKLFDRLQKIEKGKNTSRLQLIVNRHKSSLNMSTDLVSINKFSTESLKWEVKSTTSSDTYYVTQENKNCPYTCLLKCRLCSVCVHQFSCTCLDSLTRGTICKHVHLVMRFNNTVNKKPECILFFMGLMNAQRVYLSVVVLSLTLVKQFQYFLGSMNLFSLNLSRTSIDWANSPKKKNVQDHFVKFIRVSDVSNVLSKRRLLKHPTFIKPDLNLEERKVESMLLKERWSLIQSGVPRSDIKIRDLHLFVKNKLHGQITKIGSHCTFTPHDSSQPSTTPDIHQANTHISSPIVSATPVAACAPPQSTTNTSSAALVVDITPQLVQSHSHCSLNASPSQSPNPVSGNDTGQTD